MNSLWMYPSDLNAHEPPSSKKPMMRIPLGCSLAPNWLAMELSNMSTTLIVSMKPFKAPAQWLADDLYEDDSLSDLDNDSLPPLGDPKHESLENQHHPQSV